MCVILIYVEYCSFKQWLGWILKIVLLFVQPYFCWPLVFYWHLPTSGRQNTVKKGPQPFSLKGHLFPYVCQPFHLFGPSQYLSLCLSWMPKSKRFPFFQAYFTLIWPTVHIFGQKYTAFCCPTLGTGCAPNQAPTQNWPQIRCFGYGLLPYAWRVFYPLDPSFFVFELEPSEHSVGFHFFLKIFIWPPRGTLSVINSPCMLHMRGG